MALKIIRAAKRGRPKGTKLTRTAKGETVALPTPPTYDRAEDKMLHDEQQTARTEQLMMRGVRDRGQLMTLLDVHSSSQMENFIKRVKARWELGGATRALHEARGEQIAKLNMIETKLWERLQAVEEVITETKIENGQTITVTLPIDIKAFVLLIREIRETNRDRAEMVGLSKEAIEQMVMSEGDQTINYRYKAETYDRTRKLAQVMLDIVDREMRGGMKVIEHEPTD